MDLMSCMFRFLLLLGLAEYQSKSYGFSSGGPPAARAIGIGFVEQTPVMQRSKVALRARSNRRHRCWALEQGYKNGKDFVQCSGVAWLGGGEVRPQGEIVHSGILKLCGLHRASVLLVRKRMRDHPWTPSRLAFRQARRTCGLSNSTQARVAGTLRSVPLARRRKRASTAPSDSSEIMW